MNQYRGTVRYDQTTSSIYATTPFDSTLNIVNDTQTFFTLTYSEDDKEYRGTASLFFQELFRHSNIEGDPLYSKVVLIPYEGSGNSAGRPINGKTVNRISFHKDDIVLRVYYSTPTANN